VRVGKDQRDQRQLSSVDDAGCIDTVNSGRRARQSALAHTPLPLCRGVHGDGVLVPSPPVPADFFVTERKAVITVTVETKVCRKTGNLLKILPHQ